MLKQINSYQDSWGWLKSHFFRCNNKANCPFALPPSSRSSLVENKKMKREECVWKQWDLFIWRVQEELCNLLTAPSEFRRYIEQRPGDSDAVFRCSDEPKTTLSFWGNKGNRKFEKPQAVPLSSGVSFICFMSFPLSLYKMPLKCDRTRKRQDTCLRREIQISVADASRLLEHSQCEEEEEEKVRLFAKRRRGNGNLWEVAKRSRRRSASCIKWEEGSSCDDYVSKKRKDALPRAFCVIILNEGGGHGKRFFRCYYLTSKQLLAPTKKNG